MALPQTGTFYVQPNGPRGIWTQPGGPGTTVFPQQQNGPFANYPVPGQFFSETTGLFVVGCGHWVDQAYVYYDTDTTTNPPTPVVAVTCPLCSYVQYYMPRSLFADPVQNPITLI